MKKLILILASLLLVGYVNAQENQLRIGIGYAGADALAEAPVFELTYARTMGSLFSIYISYGMSTHEKSANSDIYQDTRIIGSTNTGKNPVGPYHQWHSYSLGMQIKIVTNFRSKLYITAGARNQRQKRTYLNRSGSSANLLSVAHTNTSVIGLEMGIEYQTNLNEHLAVGGRLYSMPSDVLFGGALTAAISF